MTTTEPTGFGESHYRVMYDITGSRDEFMVGTERGRSYSRPGQPKPGAVTTFSGRSRDKRPPCNRRLLYNYMIVLPI
jgi:hypothetical protein